MTLYGYARISVRELADRLFRAGGSLGAGPSLTEQQRAYIQAERPKGMSQRELAQRLEISRWTIQQVDRHEPLESNRT